MQGPIKFQSQVVRFVVEGVQYESARSLDLLRDIESTLEVNQMLTQSFESFDIKLTQTIKLVCEADPLDQKDMVDPDGSFAATFDRGLDSMTSIMAVLAAKRESALQNPALRVDDGIVESFDRVIGAAKAAHGSLNELNRAVMEYDADRAPLSGKGPFRSVEELIASFDD